MSDLLRLHLSKSEMSLLAPNVFAYDSPIPIYKTITSSMTVSQASQANLVSGALMRLV